MKEIKKTFARTLRKEQTQAEKILWKLLRNRKLLGLKFRRQHIVEGFVVDFFCLELKLGIEIDGEIHQKRKEYDALRQEIIESEGVYLMRFSNKEIFKYRKLVLKKIKEIAEQLQTNPSPCIPSGAEGLGEGSIKKFFN